MDINGGSYPNPNGSPIFPATAVTGPLVAGNVLHSDGSNNLAGLGESSGLANAGYAEMAQTQAGIAFTAGTAVQTGIVIPAQSQILAVRVMVTTVQAAATASIGTTAGAALATGVSLATLGLVTPTPTTAPQIAAWDNVGNTDVRISVTPSAAGAGVATVTVTYIQGINNVS